MLGSLGNLLDAAGRDNFYLMHLNWGRASYMRKELWEFAKPEKLIGLDFTEPVDVNRRWQDFPKSQKKRLSSVWRLQFELFAGLEKDDVVVVAGGVKHLLGVGMTYGQETYVFRKSLFGHFFRHVRKIKWLEAYSWRDRVPLKMRGFERTIKRVDRSDSMFHHVNRALGESIPIPPGLKASGKERKSDFGRKYPHGEQRAHRDLKQWVHDNPDEIGLYGGVGELEHRFETGDRVDVLFQLGRRRFAAVEVETDMPDQGVVQALKYKLLKCVEESYDITSPKVEAILVAWRKPSNQSLCRRYGIRFVQKKL